MTSSIDVLGLGIAAIDDLLYVESFPRPDQVMRIVRRERQCGGLTATALVAASRLGSASAYAGVLGEDSDSEFVMERMQAMKVDLTHLVHESGARPIRSTIIVDESSSTRTILCDLNGVVGAAPDRPEESVIRSAKVLFVDNFGIEGMIRAAQIAREAGIPVVGDFSQAGSQDIEELLSLCDHPILSLDFARGVTSTGTPTDILEVLWNEDRNTVVVTAGSEGAWALSREGIESERHYPAFRVEAVDTTGCGDVFHGAYASALARGMSVHERIRFASAAAALKSTNPGGQGGIPDRKMVEDFLQAHPE
jgi:sugar/nucleoside kinase (ribokinase family)